MPDELKNIGEAFDIEARYADYRDLLKDPEVHAVHINSPIPDECTRLRYTQRRPVALHWSAYNYEFRPFGRRIYK